MPVFIEGLLLILMIFCFCVGIATICQFARFWYENKTKSKPKSDETPKTTIYYAKETQPEKPKKKKRRKKIDLAFKDLALNPDQFEIIKQPTGDLNE